MPPISFAHLWTELDSLKKTSPDPKKEKLRREVFELFFGALWHLELAQQIKDFSHEDMQTLYGGVPLPAEHWVVQRDGVSVRPNSNELLINYHFHVPPDDRLIGLMQNTLLDDGALRIAGAWSILRDSPVLSKVGCKPVAAHPEAILDSSTGKPLPSTSSTDIKMQLVIVRALRDSLMHGEEPKDNMKKKPIPKFRDLWIKNQLPEIKYSPFVIAESCQKVLQELMKYTSSHLL